ncbi:hypothetical protein K458DRAFT_78813 [Lentithecium fluviatile CBS 122367]|uniref:Uncharacterized protein n=1 Tax=Lentithecium fluviatile CBS 122367 TaxID=1168545 RepID=A0A6G1IU35_9PLEO|nr:hypothetical protein K458DRAFT_78813 [Lentithecium fluviatile CBS 122367]
MHYRSERHRTVPLHAPAKSTLPAARHVSSLRTEAIPTYSPVPSPTLSNPTQHIQPTPYTSKNDLPSPPLFQPTAGVSPASDPLHERQHPQAKTSTTQPSCPCSQAPWAYVVVVVQPRGKNLTSRGIHSAMSFDRAQAPSYPFFCLESVRVRVRGRRQSRAMQCKDVQHSPFCH